MKSRGIRRLFAGVGTIALTVVGFQVAGTVSAFAHDNAVKGSVVCQSDGTYTVTWTVTNDYNLTETATATSHVPGSTNLSPPSLALAKNGSGTMVQSGIDGSATSAALTVNGVWSDRFSTSDSGSVSLDGTCKPAKTPTAPTGANGKCVERQQTQPSITIPADEGVTYTLDGTTKDAGTYIVSAGTHTVKASSSMFTLQEPTSFTVSVTSAPGDCTEKATAVTPTYTEAGCTSTFEPTAPTYTISTTTGVDYYVGTVKTAAGTYTATPGSTITITPQPQPGYTLTSTDPFTHTFTSATVCTSSVVATTAKFTDDKCLPAGASGSTYTVPGTNGVSYSIEGATIAAGTYPATDSSTITILATAKGGFTLTGVTQWTHTFTAKPTACSGTDSASKSPPASNGGSNNSNGAGGATAYTGVPVGQLFLIGIALLLLGAACFVGASRRRKDVTT